MALRLVRSTYIGTANIDQVFGIQFDQLGFPYIWVKREEAGQLSMQLIVMPAHHNLLQSCNLIFRRMFIQLLLASRQHTQYFITAFFVDRCENVYVSGWGGVIDADNPSIFRDFQIAYNRRCIQSTHGW